MNLKRRAGLLSILAAAWMAAPVAMAGNDIVKCVDTEGHVTLTDQPCAPGAATIRMAEERRPQGIERVAAVLPQRHLVSAAELRHPAWRPPVVRPAPLARDVATLQAAHRALMLMQGARTSLAGLQ